MKRVCAAFAAAVLLLASPVYAADAIPAGFAPGGVWLSKTSLTAGEQTTIYTVLYNGTDSTVSGTLAFLVDDASVSTMSFELATGVSRIESASWNATAGAHTITAELRDVKNASGQALALSTAKAAPVSIEVAAPPAPSVPPVVMQAVSSVASTVQEHAPAALSAVQNAYDSLEYLRENAVHVLESQLDAGGPQAQVLGTSTSNIATSTKNGIDIGALISQAWRGFLGSLLYVSKIQFLFYPLLLLVIYILYKLIRAFIFERRHSYRRYGDDY